MYIHVYAYVFLGNPLKLTSGYSIKVVSCVNHVLKISINLNATNVSLINSYYLAFSPRFNHFNSISFIYRHKSAKF